MNDESNKKKKKFHKFADLDKVPSGQLKWPKNDDSNFTLIRSLLITLILIPDSGYSHEILP